MILRKRNKQVASVDGVTLLFVKIKKMLLTSAYRDKPY